MINKIKKWFKNYIKGLKEMDKIQLFTYTILMVGFIVLFVEVGFIGLGILFLVIIIFFIFVLINNSRFYQDTDGNGIIYGSRGKGKGLLLQHKINTYKKVFSNVPYGENTELINIKEYINSIGSNTILDTINGTVKQVKKIEKFEQVNVFWDDLSVYAPNFMDRELKKHYPSLPLTLAINRHLYDAFMIITTQDRERPYKLLRELQTDFSIKALNTTGWGKLWSSIPILRNYVVVKYRYYEEVKSAEAGVLPFNAKAFLNETTKHAFLTAGQGTKEQFIATHGKVYHGRAFIRKSKVKYDTRYFHELFYGVKSPTTKEN